VATVYCRYLGLVNYYVDDTLIELIGPSELTSYIGIVEFEFLPTVFVILYVGDFNVSIETIRNVANDSVKSKPILELRAVAKVFFGNKNRNISITDVI